MNSQCQAFLQRHIQVKLERDPNTSVREMKKWLLTDQQEFDLREVQYFTLLKDISRTMSKLKQTR
jgi:hypothetical protein